MRGVLVRAAGELDGEKRTQQLSAAPRASRAAAWGSEAALAGASAGADGAAAAGALRLSPRRSSARRRLAIPTTAPTSWPQASLGRRYQLLAQRLSVARHAAGHGRARASRATYPRLEAFFASTLTFRRENLDPSCFAFLGLRVGLRRSRVARRQPSQGEAIRFALPPWYCQWQSTWASGATTFRRALAALPHIAPVISEPWMRIR